ncbi:hypothetical protein ACQKMN_16930 [Ureibacillus composti]
MQKNQLRKQPIDKLITIEIDGKPVNLRVSEHASRLYSKYYRRNLGLTLNKYGKMEDFDELLKTDRKKYLKISNQIAQIVWVFAKNADHRIPTYNKWIEEFEEFPIREIFPKIKEELNK